MTIGRQPNSSLTLSAKVNRLFQLHRSRDESEQPEAAVAGAVSRILGRAVSAGEIAALRADGADTADHGLIDGLIRHFGIPEAYLTTNGAHAENLDKQLQLLVAARDAGVKRLALRGLENDNELDGTLEVLRKIGAPKGPGRSVE